MEQLRLLNIKCLPVRYSDTFYKDLIIKGDVDFLKFALFNGFTIGSICARIEDTDNAYEKKLYIMILTVLPCYRRKGVASALLKHLLEKAADNNHLIEVYLHVQTSNTDALLFYLKHGFENVGVIENYYRRIDPPHCHILKLDLIKFRINSSVQ